MSSVNKVMLLGNLGGDPEMRSTASGQMCATLSVATSESWTDKDGHRQEKTEWHRVVCWGKTAEIAERFCRKGRQVHIEGRISYRSWEDQSGQKRYMTEVVCSQLTLVGPRDRSESGGEAESSRAPSRAPSTGQGYGSGPARRSAQPASEQPYFDDDIPF